MSLFKFKIRVDSSMMSDMCRVFITIIHRDIARI